MKRLWLIFSITLLLLLHAASAAGQWHEATGPFGVSQARYAIDPLDSNSIYVGERLLFHSSDGGKTYEKVKGFPDDIPRLRIESIAISRDKDGPIIISAGNYTLIISDDRGKTWRKFEGNEELGPFRTVHAGPAGSGLFYATSSSGAKRSSDNGKTWERCGDESKPGKAVPYLIVDRYDVNTLSSMFFKGSEPCFLLSRDGGKSFNQVPFPKGEDFIASTSTDPEDKKLLYVCGQENGRGGGYRKKFYYSYDEGETWDVYWDPVSGDKIPEAVDKKLKLIMPEMLVSPLPDKYRTMPSRRSLSWSEDKPGHVICAIDSDIVRSDDFGKTWESANDGLVATMVRGIVIDPEDSNCAFSCAYREVYHTTDGGKTWVKMAMQPVGLIRDMKYSPDGGSFIIVAYGICRGTRDGGEWERVWWPENYEQRLGGLYFGEKEIGEDKKEVNLFVPGNKFLLQSSDGGKTWEEVCKTELKIGGGQRLIRTLQIERDGKEIWYMPHYGAVRSDDQGRTWTNAKDEFGRSFIEWSLGPDNTIWLLDYNYLRVLGKQPRQTLSKLRRDKGRDVFSMALVRDPTDKNTGYIGSTNGRILRTTDGGKTLVELEGGPVGVPIISLTISPHDGTLWVGTDGNGVWLLENPKKHPAVSSEK